MGCKLIILAMNIITTRYMENPDMASYTYMPETVAHVGDDQRHHPCTKVNNERTSNRAQLTSKEHAAWPDHGE